MDLKNKYNSEVKELDNTYFIGRLAEYRYYAMDDAVEAALGLYNDKLSKL